MKRDADQFGSKDIDLPIPPSCLITVWADLSCNPKTHLRHPVTLTGIDCNTRKIYISRFLETVDTINTTGIYDYYHYYYGKSTDYYIQNLLVIQDIHRIVLYHIKQLLLHLIQVMYIIIHVKFH